MKTIPVSWVHEKFNIPMPKDGEETIVVNQIPGIPNPLKMKSCPVCLTNKITGADPLVIDQKAIESLISKVIPDAINALKANEQKILEAIQSSTSYNEAVAKAVKLYPEMNRGKFQELLSQFIFNARAFGGYTVRNNPPLTRGVV